MLLKLTRSAESSRIIKGINIGEIEENLVRGIKTIQKDGVLSTYNNRIVLHTKIDNVLLVKMVSIK